MPSPEQIVMLAEAVVYDTLMNGRARDDESAALLALARQIVHDLIESGIRLDTDVVPPERHNHDPIGLYANCPACGTVKGWGPDTDVEPPPQGP